MNITLMPSRYRIITLDRKLEWESYLFRSDQYDFYHTPEYHQLADSGEPFLFVFEHDADFVALPLLKRKIPGTSYYDCTSVYGYPGPISNLSEDKLSAKIINNFADNLTTFLLESGILSVFSRLHPIINRHLLWDDLGNVRHHGRTVTIDLHQTLEDQRGQYYRTTVAKFKLLASEGFTVKEAVSIAELRRFIGIYHENMRKVNAQTCYYFNEQYFKKLLKSTSYKTSLVLCSHGSELAAGAIITFTREIMQLHLTATNNYYLPLSPLKFLIDGTSCLGRVANMKYLHMGGGVGGNEDSLFQFKAGFSKNLNPFKTLRLISDQQVYDKLVREQCDGSLEAADFFPLYRCAR